MTMSTASENKWWTGFAPYDDSPLAPIPHTTRYEFQRGRFDNPNTTDFNVTLLKEYVCWATSTYKYTDYYPVCTFPYINKGWYKDGDNGPSGTDYFSDVVPNDCSITMHDAFGKGYNEYDSMCATYTVISAIPIFICAFFLKVMNQEKKGKDRKKGLRYLLPSNPNLAEKMLFLNMWFCISMMMFCTDMHGYAGRVPLYSNYLISRTTLIGFMAATPVQLR